MEVSTASANASFGALTSSDVNRRRALDVEARVGDYRFDNTHPVLDEAPDFGSFMDFATRFVPVPLDDEPDAIRAALWQQTEQRYRRAVEQLAQVRANAQVRVQAEDSSPDFSREPPVSHIEPLIALSVDRSAWEEKVRRYSAPFARHGDIYYASAQFHASVETRWYVNSEGSELQTVQPIYRLMVTAVTKADDGMELPRYASFFALTPEGLPSDSVVLAAVEKIIADLAALRRAPIVAPYTGPAILSGRASAVFFHEVFGHRVEGDRQKREEEGQTFKKKVGEALLPPDFSVYFDPTTERQGAADLAGAYRFDDEGVKARRVAVVENGRFKTFLMSRSPIEGFIQSNGHGRREVGFRPGARQSNLIVSVARPRTRPALKQQLLQQLRREGKPFGLFFDDIEGGFTLTGRTIPNAFNVLPIMVYRIFPDGREELVRGVDLIGTPLTTFSRIVAGDDRVDVFNGMCGAESGSVPVSAVSPGVLIAQVEVQKKSKSVDRPPLLPPPTAEAGPAGRDVLMRAMRDELKRSMERLRLDTMPGPYFIAYRVDEVDARRAAARRGSLVESDRSRGRRVTVELRVGDYAFDNTNFLGGTGRAFGSWGGAFTSERDVIPLDDNYLEIRRHLWLATDGAYKSAVETLANTRAALQHRAATDYVPDFSRESVTTSVDTPAVALPDLAEAEALVRQVSAQFKDRPLIRESSVDWGAGVVRSWYVNSEGTSFTRVAPGAALSLGARVQATDGMMVGDGVRFYGPRATDLPGVAALADSVRAMTSRLERIREAPAAERYQGPVLFEGEAAAELFGSVFAPQLEAARAVASDNPMFESFAARRRASFLDRVGTRVLPRFMSVTDDPTRTSFAGRPLLGYKVDDDGVPARATKLIERGMLRTLVTTRVPVNDLRRSTGNRRGDEVSVSNVLVTVDSGLDPRALRKRALDLAAENGNPFVVVVRRVGSQAALPDPMSFVMFAAGGDRGAMVPPAVIVKLYPDGREEPVRGAQIEGITPASFRDIVAAGAAPSAHTGATRGWDDGAFIAPARGSGWVGPTPTATSFIVPSLLFEEATMRRQEGRTPKTPFLKPPWEP
jgi:predicted Zn-dependent protease